MRTPSTVLTLVAAGLGLALAGCKQPSPEPTGPAARPDARPAAGPVTGPDAGPAPTDLGRLDRETFNKAAVRLNLPLFWTADRNGNQRVEPDEVVTLLFYAEATRWVEGGAFTPAFLAAYEQLVKAAGGALPQGLAPDEAQRRTLVLEELDQGRPTLVWSDLRSLSAEEKALVKRMQKVADLIDQLYAQQCGIVPLRKDVPAADPASQSLFRRNWGPRCEGPRTEKNPACTAIPGGAKPRVDVYPADLQADKLCETLAKHPDAKTLLAPFVVVRKQGDKLVPEPYHLAFKDLMGQVASELEAAAKELTDPKEEALRRYLREAAKAFTTNQWDPADEAWAKMDAENSRWYLRVGPDETYWEPCSQKAGFHVTFARINPDGLAWQRKLGAVQQEMEDRLAAAAGAPYRARKVSFHLPDFIDIVLNAGDDRKPFGATIGQSLPNWGPVANQGRGRTVAMSNLYADPDSKAVRRKTAESLFAKEVTVHLTDSPIPGLLGTMIHEAAHNLGPAHEYQVNGKKDGQVFGGPLASMLEELKAQTAALWFIDFLLQKGVITKELAQQSYVDAIYWGFGHISRGMYDADGKPKPYSQLAAIQTAFLMKEGAITFDKDALAANGKDQGAFRLDLAKFPAAVDKLMRIVGGIKAKGDKARAEALVKELVDGDVVPHKLVAERVLRYPKVSFVYGLDL
jgi:hypothetical protein